MYAVIRSKLSHHEATRLCKFLKTPREKLVIYTLLDAGLKISELSSLKKGEFKIVRRNLLFRGRIIEIMPRTAMILQNWFALYERADIARRTIITIVERVAHRSGLSIKITPRVLRYSFALNCKKRGHSIESIRKMLGHSSIRTTTRFLNLNSFK